MSINPTSSFNFDGVVSGLNTTSIIQKMMSLYSAPLTSMQNHQSDVKARDAAYQAIKVQLSSLQTAYQTLLRPSNVNAKTTSSSSSGVATATANSDAINGSFGLTVNRLATATQLVSNTPISLGVDDGSTSGAKLNAAGFSTAVTAGSFTINGVSISVDPANDRLADVVSRINASTAGVTASLVNDANGNPNFIKLTPNVGNTNAIQLGSVGDTTNFLAATHLVATGVSGGGAGGAVTSNAPLSEVNTGANLSAGRFAAGALDASGSFTVNGTTINWSNTDSLATVINRINTSNAGVRATYDATSDKVTFTNLTTGNQTMTLSDAAPGAGKVGFLQALGLNAANEVVGQTAQYQITQNGVAGPTLFSNSNSITNALPGVSLTLAGTGTTTVTVAQDTQTAINNVQTFVSAFNSLVDLIDKDTAYDSTKKQASVLTGDMGIQSLEGQLRTLVSSAAPGVSGQYTSLGNLGISTGAFGSAVGTTNHLTLDTSKLTAALQNNPNAVVSLFGGTPTATLNPDGSGNATAGSWISSVSGTPSGQNGSYKLTVDSTGAITSVFTPVGSTALGAVAGSLTGGQNSTLISGVTIKAGALPASGTASDTIWVGGSGVLGRLDAFVTTALGTNGVFQSESDSANSELTDLTNRINDMNVQLAQQQQTLQNQFTAMETALAQINSQGGSLMASMGSTSMLPSTSSSSGSSH